MSRHRTDRLGRSSDEGGSILPLVTLLIVTLMVSSALAIDLGSVAATNRRLQAVADLAASAAASELTGDACDFTFRRGGLAVNTPKSLFQHVHEAAKENAAKNGFPEGPNKTLVVETGILQYSNTGEPTFQPTHSSLTGPDCLVSNVPAAVRVTAGDYTEYAFGNVIGMKGMTTFRSGTAGRKNMNPGHTNNCVAPCTPTPNPNSRLGGFAIGSSVANLDTNNSQVLSAVLNKMVCGSTVGCSLSTSLVGYQGLASSTITLGQLQSKLNAGSMNALLDTSIRANELYLASAKALGCNQAAGCNKPAAVTLFGMATSVTSTTTFKLRDMFVLNQGSEKAAADTSINILKLVTGSAQLINGTNAVSVPVTTVSIPGTTSTTISIKIIEAPKTYLGVVGGSVSTSQAEVTATQTLNLLNIPVAGALLSPVASITGTLPIKVTAGSATGTLAEVNCAPVKNEVVSVDTNGSTAVIGDTNTANKFLSLNVNVLGLFGGLQVLGLNVNGSASVAGVNDRLLSFSYPSEWQPQTMNPKHVGGTTLNVQGTGLNSSVSTLLGLTLNASAVTTALTGPGGVVTLLDTAVISPVLRALGIDVGGADVWAIGKPECLGGAPYQGPPK